MFKVGDLVRISKDSMWYGEGPSNPTDTVGRVIEVGGGFSLPVKVEWSPGVTNRYNALSLEVAYPNPPHKHRDPIIAWANGATIEVKGYADGEWLKADRPAWHKDRTYRIKSTPSKSPAQLEKESIVTEMEKLQERLDKLEVE